MAASLLSRWTNQPFVSTRYRRHAHFPHKTPSLQNISLTHNCMLDLVTAGMARAMNIQHTHNHKQLMSHAQICHTLTSQPVPTEKQKRWCFKKNLYKNSRGHSEFSAFSPKCIIWRYQQCSENVGLMYVIFQDFLCHRQKIQSYLALHIEQ